MEDSSLTEHKTKSRWGNERWGVLAGAILMTIALPIAIDQGYFRYNAYILPLLGLFASLLYIGFAITSRFLIGFVQNWMRTQRNWCLSTCIIASLIITGGIATGFCIALQKSKQHVADAKAAEAGVITQNSGQLDSNIGTTTNRVQSANGSETVPDQNQSSTTHSNKPRSQETLHTRQPPTSPVLKALEIVEFNSTHSIILFNKSSESIFALDAVVTTHSLANRGNESISYPLDSEIGPKQTQSFTFKIDGDLETLLPTGGSWEDQWNAAIQNFKGCLHIAFLSPSSAALRQVVDHYQEQGMILPIGEATGTISYKISSSDKVIESIFPLKAILMKKKVCQP